MILAESAEMPRFSRDCRITDMLLKSTDLLADVHCLCLELSTCLLSLV